MSLPIGAAPVLATVLFGCSLLTSPDDFEREPTIDSGSDGGIDDAAEPVDAPADVAGDASDDVMEVVDAEQDSPADAGGCNCLSTEVCIDDECVACDDDDDGFVADDPRCDAYALQQGLEHVLRDCDDSDAGRRPLVWDTCDQIESVCPDPTLEPLTSAFPVIEAGRLPAIRVTTGAQSGTDAGLGTILNDLSLAPREATGPLGEWLVAYRTSDGYRFRAVVAFDDEPVKNEQRPADRFSADWLGTTELVDMSLRHLERPNPTTLWAMIGRPQSCVRHGRCHHLLVVTEDETGVVSGGAMNRPGNPMPPLTITSYRRAGVGMLRPLLGYIAELPQAATLELQDCNAGRNLLSHDGAMADGFRCVGADPISRTSTSTLNLLAFRSGGTLVLWDGRSNATVNALPVVGRPQLFMSLDSTATPLLLSDRGDRHPQFRQVSITESEVLGPPQSLNDIPYPLMAQTAQSREGIYFFTSPGPADDRVDLFAGQAMVGQTRMPVPMLDQQSTQAPIRSVNAMQVMVRRHNETAEVVVSANLTVDRMGTQSQETWLGGVRYCP